jgi:hypothetical protein
MHLTTCDAEVECMLLDVQSYEEAYSDLERRAEEKESEMKLEVQSLEERVQKLSSENEELKA